MKDVHPERVLTRSLMAATAEGVAAAQHAQYSDCEGGDGICISKRPGRMTTRPTFSLQDNVEDAEEEEEEQRQQQQRQKQQGWPKGGQRVANDTYTYTGISAGGSSAGGASPQRRRQRSLLQGKQTLASILQADAVWAQGFRGKGVKMGVFDTGIKGDHPDVKHIV